MSNLDMMTLVDLCQLIKDGDWIESKDQADYGIRLVQTGNIGLGKYINKMGKEKYISEDTFSKLKCTEVCQGDILISRLPTPVGRACIIPKMSSRMITAVDCTIIRLNKEKISEKYFVYYTQSQRYQNQVNKYITGSTRVRISRKNLEKVLIPVQPLSVQKYIENILDNLQEIIDCQKQMLEELDDLIKSTFYNMFGNPNENKFDKRNLTEIVQKNRYSIKRGPFGGSLKKEDFVDKGYLVYEQRHAIHNDFKYEKYYISQEKFDEMKAFIVEPKDLIISCSGVTLGRIAEVPLNAKEGIINQALLKISLDNSIMNNKFFMYLFRNEVIQDILFGISRGSGIPNFPSMEIIKSIGFITPPIDLQNKFSEVVVNIEEQKAVLTQSLTESETLFNSLISKYFDE
jgi:type I restriction enzyme, S subunit